MIVSVFGASGRTGHAFVRVAAEAGLYQRLHYRNKPSELIPDTATVVVGALTDPTAVREVLRGADAVFILFGPHPNAPRVFCAAATKAIIAGMRTQSVPRIICVTGAMIGEMPGNVALTFKMMSFGIRKTGQAEMMEDRDEQERLVRSSRLSWTLVKPPRLTDGTAGTIDAGPTVSVGMGSHLSRESLAKFLVEEAQRPQYAESAVYLKDR
jgi:putative NADH-flavin reductase